MVTSLLTRNVMSIKKNKKMITKMKKIIIKRKVLIVCAITVVRKGLKLSAVVLRKIKKRKMKKPRRLSMWMI